MDRTRKYGKLALPFDSHPISSFVRKAFDKTRYKRILLANAAMLGVVFVGVAQPSHAFDYSVTSQVGIESPAPQVTTKTESKFGLPVLHPLGVSQHFYVLHPGIDIRAPRGSEVVAAAAGMVVEVQYTNIGYGHYVRVAHEGTVSTLYAHMDKILVHVGQRLDKGQQIGTIGTTGWSTGPHLHFEVHEGIQAINPESVITIN